MTAPKCIGCPFRRDCPGCPWSGESPAAATVSDARTGAAQGILMGPHKEAAPAGAANTSCSGASPFKMGRTYRDGTP